MVEAAEDVLKGCLIKMWRDAKSPKDMKTFFDQTGRLIVKEGTGIPLGPEGDSAFRTLVAELQKDDTIRKQASVRTIEKEVENSLFSIKDANEREIESKAGEAVALLLQRLKAQPKTWTNIVPVVNLDIQIDELQIGRVVFRKFMERDFLDTIGIIKVISRETSEDNVKTGVSDIYRQILYERFLNKAFVKTTVEAIDSTRSREISLELIDTSINILRFYACGLFYPVYRNYRPYINIEGFLFGDVCHIITYIPLGEHALNKQMTGYLYPMEINDDAVAKMKENGLDVLHALLLKDEPSEFESKIMNAIKFYGTGTNNEDDASAFISIMIALESLLLKKREPPKGLLAERVAFLLGNNYDQKLALFRRMQDSYQIRSNIVHFGNRDFPVGELYLLSRIAFYCIVKLIQKSGEFKTISDFINWIQKEKFT